MVAMALVARAPQSRVEDIQLLSIVARWIYSLNCDKCVKGKDIVDFIRGLA